MITSFAVATAASSFYNFLFYCFFFYFCEVSQSLVGMLSNVVTAKNFVWFVVAGDFLAFAIAPSVGRCLQQLQLMCMKSGFS